MEFARFYDKLLKNAPEKYTPWIFPVVQKGKAPDTRMSWKATPARLTRAQADERLSQGYNVGISGRKDDRLILVDIDDPSIEDELKNTLKIRSRSRTGTHAFYWAAPDDEKLPANIPTKKGEVRSSDQYVVAPGSYVPCTEEELNGKIEDGDITQEMKRKVMNDSDRGMYTLDNNKDIATIRFNELPQVFQDHETSDKERKKQKEEAYADTSDFNPEQVESNGERSALYDLQIEDVAPNGYTKRDPHPTHGSTTYQETGTGNWIINNGLGHCWRHLVSLNAIQYLTVKQGYFTCQEAGTPHKNSSQAASKIIGDDKSIWIAWQYAKKHGYIPEDDRVPVRALHHLAREHELCPEDQIPEQGTEETLPYPAYKRALEIIEDEY